MKLQLLLALVISLMFSCNKSSGPEQAPAKLKQVLKNDIPDSKYEYNNEGHVSRIVTYGLYSIIHTDLNYTEDRIAGITKFYLIGSDEPEKSEVRTFQYDAANRLSGIQVRSMQIPLIGYATYQRRYEFSYKGSSKLFSTCIVYAHTETGDVQELKHEFTYDSRGNILKRESYVMENKVWKPGDWQQYEYERVPNPYYQVSDPLSFVFNFSRDFWVKYTRNSSTDPDIITTVTRSYYLQGGKIISSKTNSGNEDKYEYY